MQNWADNAISWVDIDKLKSTPILGYSYSINQESSSSSSDSSDSSGKDSAENQKNMAESMQQTEELAAMEAAQKIKEELVEVRKNGGTPNKQKMQQDICNLVSELELEIARSEALSCYDEAKRKRDNKKATECLKQLKNAELARIEKNRKKWEKIKIKANTVFEDFSPMSLDIDENTGALNSKDEWCLKYKGIDTKNGSKCDLEYKEVAEEKEITMPSEKEGEKGTTKKVWVAKQSVIKELNDGGFKQMHCNYKTNAIWL